MCTTVGSGRRDVPSPGLNIPRTVPDVTRDAEAQIALPPVGLEQAWACGTLTVRRALQPRSAWPSASRVRRTLLSAWKRSV